LSSGTGARLRSVLGVVAAASLLVAACGDDDGDARAVPTTEVDPQEDPIQQPVEDEAAGGLPTPACDSAFAEAAVDAPGEVAALEAAAEACISLDDWIAADAANPDALGGEDPTVFAENVCDAGGEVAEASLCQELQG
jgi:hypothetical protein